MEISGQLKRILVLVSGSGSNLQAIIDACESGCIKGAIVGVISNVPEVYALERAKRHNIPCEIIDHKAFENRKRFDEALEEKVQTFSADLIVLAGFMRILDASFVSQYAGKMINIHPSLLPKYPGLHTHKRALQNKDSEHGASIHFVNAELDGGPVIVQSIVKVDLDDTIETLQEKVVRTEWQIYPMVVKWFCIGALRLHQDKVWFDNKIVEQSIKNERLTDYKMMIHNNHGNHYVEDLK